MKEQVLITYATKRGATAEIAEKIGDVLRQAGLTVDVRRIEEVDNLAPYSAVILGSAVYFGKWRKEAVKFLQVNEQWLAERPVWLFSSGPTGEGEAEELLQGWRYPEALQPTLDRIQPRDIALFHGRLDTQDLNFIERWVVKNVKAPVGDFRDWQAVTAWATAVAAALQESALQKTPEE